MRFAARLSELNPVARECTVPTAPVISRSANGFPSAFRACTSSLIPFRPPLAREFYKRQISIVREVLRNMIDNSWYISH